MDDIPVAPLPDTPRSRPAVGMSSAGKFGPAAPPEPPRRSFFYNLFTAVVGGLVGVVPLVAGIAVYLDPMRKKIAAATLLPVATIDKLPDASKEDALIGRFQILADRIDAWNIFPNEPVGGVYLVVPKGTKTIKALHATCPHLGCGVDLREEADGKFSFRCPCHTSSFTSDGSRIMPCVSPRDMDELECQMNPLEDGRTEVLVKFQNFLPGVTEKKAKS